MKENILIVDDEPDIRDVISVILNDEGYKTNCVSNAQEAQAKINIAMIATSEIRTSCLVAESDGIKGLKATQTMKIHTN